MISTNTIMSRAAMAALPSWNASLRLYLRLSLRLMVLFSSPMVAGLLGPIRQHAA